MVEKVKPRIPVIVCDPGCRDKRGHHYEFNNFLQEEIEISECLTNIHSKIPEYKKVFYHSPYSIVPAEHKQIYQEQIAADAALIAELSSNKICIIQHASRLLIQALHKQRQCSWENIVIPFPKSPASGLSEIEPKFQICYDRWFKPTFGSAKPYFYFPRSRVWFERRPITDVDENTILFLGSKREEKLFEAFVAYAKSENLIAKTMPAYSAREAYIESIFKAEFIWCGYGDAFAHKPSNTLLDGVCAQKTMILSKDVTMMKNGFLPGRKSSLLQHNYLKYEPQGKFLLLKNNELFLKWLSASLA